MQGNRTCGIDHRPTDAFLDRLAYACGIEPPRAHGLDTVGTIEAMHRGDVKVFVGMGIGLAFSVPLAVGISALEIIVILVQAYVFTLLTAVFIGMAIHAHH